MTEPRPQADVATAPRRSKRSPLVVEPPLELQPFRPRTAEDAPSLEDAYRLWRQNPSPENAALMLRSAEPVISTAVSSYGGQYASRLLHSRARLLALEALETYDPRKGSLRNHLLSQLQGLRRYQQQAASPVRVPERLRMDASRLRQMEQELEVELGRLPSTDEISRRTGLSRRRIEHLRSSYKQPIFSGQLAHVDSDEDGDVYEPAVRFPFDQTRRNLLIETLYYDLDDVDKAILDHTWGLHGAKPLDNRTLARKLRITPGAVSQRRAKIQRLLDSVDKE